MPTKPWTWPRVWLSEGIGLPSVEGSQEILLLVCDEQSGTIRSKCGFKFLILLDGSDELAHGRGLAAAVGRVDHTALLRIQSQCVREYDGTMIT